MAEGATRIGSRERAADHDDEMTRASASLGGGEGTTSDHSGRAAPAAPPSLRSPFVAVVLHPILVVATIAATVAVAYNWASDQPSTYEAESTLVVGRIDVPSNAVPGYVQANNTLAETYARFVGTDLHVADMAQLVETDVATIEGRGDIEASNVEQSAIIRIRTTPQVEEAAVELADLAALALIDLVGGVNDPGDTGDRLFDDHSEAAASVAAAQAVVEQLERDLIFQLENDLTAAASNTELDLEQARADLAVRELNASTLAALYTESQQVRVGGELLRVLTESESQGSDRSSRVQLGVALGFLGGLALAVALAWAVTNAKPLWQLRQSLKARGPAVVVDEAAVDRSDADTRTETATSTNGDAGERDLELLEPWPDDESSPVSASG